MTDGKNSDNGNSVNNNQQPTNLVNSTSSSDDISYNSNNDNNNNVSAGDKIVSSDKDKPFSGFVNDLKDNVGNAKTYDQTPVNGKSGALNNLSRGVDKASRTLNNVSNGLNNASNKLNNVSKRINNYSDKNPNTKRGDIADKASSGVGSVSDKVSSASNKVGNASDKLGSINKKLQMANNINNIKNNPSAAKDMVVEVAKDEVKKKIIMWVLGASIGCLPIALIILIVIVFVVLIITIIGTSDVTNTNTITYGDECGFTISETLLSKEQFTSRLTEYANNTNSYKSEFQTFSSYADSIYDIATAYNINPELVVVRALSEGFSPGGTTNNYWGINCTNTGGGTDCKRYVSFTMGVKAFVESASNDANLKDFMSHYSYIGTYWYNPGGSGIGGCYYANYIYNDSNIPTRVSRACGTNSPSCTVSNTTNCIKTTDEDQDAYATWQVRNMLNNRNKIFGSIDSSMCSSSVSSDVSSVIKLSDADVWKALTDTDDYKNVSKETMDSHMTTISVPIRVWASTDKNNYDTEKVTKSLTVNKLLGPLFVSFFNDIYNTATDFVINPKEIYCYNYRNRTSGSSLSAHAYGAACDINWSTLGNGYGDKVYTKASWESLSKSKEKSQIIYKGSKVVEIAHKYTLSWGGEWSSTTDAMHFSFIGDVSRSSLQS